MSDSTLLELAKEVRWKTLKLLEGVDDAQARWAPAGTNNHLLWHAGHALVVVEHLTWVVNKLGEPQLPAGWFEKFSWDSKPAEVKDWPAIADVVERLKTQRERFVALLPTLTRAQLDTVVGPAPRSRTTMGMIVHAFHDEAGHQGEMYLLKKLWKLRA
jgi:hypothetical protein